MEFPSLATIFAYLGMVIAIIAIRAKEKTQRILFLVGPLLLLFGAIGLGNKILIASQLVVAVAGALGFMPLPKKAASTIVALFGLATFGYMYRANLLSFDWSLVGAFGFLALALGIAASPKKLGSFFLALGGGLMIAYSVAFWAVPWIILNIPFTIIAISAMLKKNPAS